MLKLNPCLRIFEWNFVTLWQVDALLLFVSWRSFKKINIPSAWKLLWQKKFPRWRLIIRYLPFCHYLSRKIRCPVTPTSRGTRGCAPTPTSTTLATTTTTTTTTTTWLKLGRSIQMLKISCFKCSSNLFKSKKEKKIILRLQSLQDLKQAIPRLINIDG